MDKDRPKRALLGPPSDDVDILRSLIAKKKRQTAGGGGGPNTEDSLHQEVEDEDEGEADKEYELMNGKIDHDEGEDGDNVEGDEDKKPARRKRIIKRKTRILPKRGANKNKEGDEDEVEMSELAQSIESYSSDQIIDLEDTRKNYNEKQYEVGDIISVLSDDDGKYFAQIIGFHQNRSLQLFVSVRWLVPKPHYFGILPSTTLEQFDPMFFEPGPIHEPLIGIEYISFESHEPLSFT